MSKPVRCLFVLALLVWSIAPRAFAPTPAGLDIHLYAGLNIAGAPGTVYAIEATTDAAQSNGWTCVTFLQLQNTNYLWLDPTAPVIGRRFYRAEATAPTNLVFIPPGTFRMGSPTNEVGRFDDEGPQTEVTLTKGFYMGKYPVNEADYWAVVGGNPTPSDPNYPVGSVAWYDATNYCAKRTQQEAATGMIPQGSKYRLPTEAEWEYACRAWTSTRFFYGEDQGYTNLLNYAWYSGNSEGAFAHPVGQKLPNRWGLYDMVGNVRQWCQDRSAPYPGGSVTDPQGLGSDSYFVVRGGGSDSDASGCRSAFRNSRSSGSARFHFGFRVVLVPAYP
jgi:formylglycine-generating enzyme required for sulfatase activity